MRKISYKYIAVFILIVSIGMLISMRENDVNDYIKNILVTISINLISSVIIIYLIDFKIENDKQAEIEEKRKIIYRQLILPLKKFDEFVLNMYNSTLSPEEIEKLEYSIENVDDIIEKLKLINNEDRGYLYSLESRRPETWKEIMIIHSLEFIEVIEKFYINNLNYLSNNLTDNLVNVIDVKCNEYILIKILRYNSSITTEDLLKVLNFKKLLVYSFCIKEEILEYYEEDLFEVKKKISKHSYKV